MNIKLSIECDNAAFESMPGYEVSRILHRLADRIKDEARYNLMHMDSLRLHDSNGNTVGHVEVTK